MNLHTLELFCEIARRKSFSKGARAMGISQSAASQAVAQLEADLNLILVDRAKRPFALTTAGQSYFEGVRELLSGHDKLIAELRSAKQEISGTVRVAAIYSVGIRLMSRLIQQFMTQYPQSKVRIQYLRPNKVVDEILEDDADLGLISYPTASRDLAVIPLRNEKMVFVCAPTHKLAGKKEILASELNEDNFIGFDSDLPIRKAIDRSLRAGKGHPNVSMEFDNIETIKQAVLLGAGSSILPEPSLRREVELGLLKVIPLGGEMADLHRPIGIIHRPRRLTPAAQKLVDLLCQETDESKA